MTPASPPDLLSRDGQARLHPGFADPAAYAALVAELDWQQERIRMFGREHPVPRLIAYYGEHPYRYAGVEHPARPMPQRLQALAERITTACGFPFNCVLANYYRDGRDSMGYHRDNEAEIDPACIASLSLGATRRFKLRHRGTREVVDVDLPDGCLLLMLDCQEQWEHALPRTRKPVGGRVNLTFRRVGRVR